MTRPVFALMFASMNWQEIPALPAGVSGGAVTFQLSSVIYAGGTTWQNGSKLWLKDVWLYKPATDAWKPAPPLPSVMAYGAFATVNGALEIYGGTDGSGLSRTAFRLVRGSWVAAGPANPHPLLARAEAIGDRVYVPGGCTDVAKLETCTDAVLSRTGDGDWERVSMLPHGRVAMYASAAVGSRIYLFGGCSTPLANRAEAYVYDTAHNSWKRLRNLPEANRGLSALRLSDRSIYLAGGYTDKGFTAEAMIYDVGSDTYRTVSPLPIAAAGIELLMREDRIYALGGEDRMKSRSARVFVAHLE